MNKIEKREQILGCGVGIVTAIIAATISLIWPYYGDSVMLNVLVAITVGMAVGLISSIAVMSSGLIKREIRALIRRKQGITYASKVLMVPPDQISRYMAGYNPGEECGPEDDFLSEGG